MRTVILEPNIQQLVDFYLAGETLLKGWKQSQREYLQSISKNKRTEGAEGG